jgi:AraC-like DNA-binding protein
MTWQDIEAKRALTPLSRAEMCRRAGISESTATKGLQRNGEVSRLLQNALLKVLVEAAGQNGRAA